MRTLKKLTRNYFIFSKKERNVALYLAFAILVTSIMPSVQKYFFPKQTVNNYDAVKPLLVSMPAEQKEDNFNSNYHTYSYPANSEKWQHKKFPENKNSYSKNNNINLQLFEFDPNIITAEQWMQLGISKWLAERIINYRSKGGKFKKKEDLLKTYGFTNEDFARLEPYILIDTIQFNSTKNNSTNIPIVISDSQETIEVNTALKEQFMLLGFSADNAIRIIKFRESSGGIYSIDQLNSVFGIDMESLENARTFLTVDKNHLIKININVVSLEQLANHVYISDELAKSIIDYRNSTGKFYTITELMKVKGMYPTLFEKLKPYLIL